MERIQELKKHTAAIHCANSLSLLQRKISNVLLHHAYYELLSKEEHEITVKELCNKIGYKGNNHAAIKDSLRGLITTLVEWNITDNEGVEEDWTASTVLASVRIKGSLCRYAYSPRMRDLLYSPSMYGKINLITQSKFRSSYGLALYENCVRYKELSYTKWLELNAFRKLMGVSSSKYVVFRDLKKRVIDKSVQEVNLHSDLEIHCETRTSGRKVSKIRFKLAPKRNIVKLGLKEEEHSQKFTPNRELIDSLSRDFLLGKTKSNNLLQQYTPEYISEKIKLIRTSKLFASGEITNLGGYLIDALKKDYKFSFLRQAPTSMTETQTQFLKSRLENTTSEEHAWKDKLQYLKNDLKHWEELLAYTSNLTAINNIKVTISECKKSINDHLSNKPIKTNS